MPQTESMQQMDDQETLKYKTDSDYKTNKLSPMSQLINAKKKTWA